MTFTVWTKNDSGNSRNLRAVQQYVGCLAAVLVDQSHVGKSIERSGRRFAGEPELIQP